MRALPVTTPSPRIRFFSPSMPKSRQRCTTNRSISTNVPGSTSRSMRSRAVSLPFWCWASMRSWPPPCSDRSRISCNLRMASVMDGSGIFRVFDKLGEHAAEVPRVDEGDLAAVGARPRRLVEQRCAGLGEHLDLLLAVGDVEGEVVDAGPALLQELRNRRVRRGR